MGVRCRSHSLKGMKLRLKAIRERMRCVVFRFPFKDISFSSSRTLSNRFVSQHRANDLIDGDQEGSKQAYLKLSPKRFFTSTTNRLPSLVSPSRGSRNDVNYNKSNWNGRFHRVFDSSFAARETGLPIKRRLNRSTPVACTTHRLRLAETSRFDNPIASWF